MRRDGSLALHEQPSIGPDGRTLTWPRPAPGGDEHRPLYFLHVPKTAGTALNFFLRTMYRVDEVCPAYDLDELKGFDPASLRQFRYFAGHLSLALLPLLDEPPAIVTLVREPSAQTRSAYEHGRRSPGHWLHKFSADSTYLEWLRDERTTPFISNPQARYLSGAISAKEQVPDDELFERALATLDMCMWIGTTENLDDSVAELASCLRWPAPHRLLRANAAPEAPPAPTDEEAEIIASVTAVDHKLYEHVRARAGTRQTGSSDRTLRRWLRTSADSVSSPLTIELAEPFWGSGWWPAEANGAVHVRWTPLEGSATVDLPVRLRRGDCIDFHVRQAPDGRLVREMDVKVGRAFAQLIDLRQESECVVARFRVSRSSRRWSRLLISTSGRSTEARPYLPLYTDGRAVAFERIVLVPRADAQTPTRT